MNKTQFVTQILQLTGYKRSIHPDITFAIHDLLDKYEKSEQVDRTKAEILFKKLEEWVVTEDEMDDEIIEIFGLERQKNIYSNITYDHYDTSFEIKGVRPGLNVKEFQIKKAWDLGFHRFWICYTDGTEKYYYEK